MKRECVLLNSTAMEETEKRSLSDAASALID